MKIPDFSQEFKGMDASFPCLTEQPTRYVTIRGKLFYALSASPVNCSPYRILSSIYNLIIASARYVVSSFIIF